MSGSRKSSSESKDYFTYSSLDTNSRKDSWRQRGSFSFSSNNYESDKWSNSSYFTYSQPVQTTSNGLFNSHLSKNNSHNHGSGKSTKNSALNKRRETLSDTRSIRSMDERDYSSSAYTSLLMCGDLFSEASQIISGLYLSGLKAVTVSKLRQLNITLLVTAMKDNIVRAPAEVETVSINVDDIESADIQRYFHEVLPIIQGHMPPNGSVLVHCVAGISRSATLVIAYLMRYHKMNLNTAYSHVKSKRSCIQPNAGFWKQLVNYESTLNLNGLSKDGSKSKNHNSHNS